MSPPSEPPRRSDEARPPVEEAAWALAGRVLREGKLQATEIGISEEGTILSIGRSVRASARRDVGEAVILPSATDLHVHFRDPGGSADVESFAAGTIEAAIGGVGLIGDMPNTDPPVTDRERFETKRGRVTGRAAVDVLLYGALTPGARVEELGGLVGGFKLYCSPTTGIEAAPTREEIGPLLERAYATGLPVSVHAEDPGLFRSDPSPRDLADWDRARPATAETSAVGDLLAAAPDELRLHFAHVTQRSVGERIAAAGRSFEVAPHHLLLSDRSSVGTFGKVNPPLRAEGVRAELEAAFYAGSVPILASDHAPHSASAKSRPFAEAPAGVPGVETMLPLFLARVRDQKLPLEVLLAAAAKRPAHWVGQPRGVIAIGARADLLVVDFRVRRTIRARDLHGPCGWTPFEGWEAIFPVEHYRRGRAIVRGGEYVGRPTGEIVRPMYAA